MNNSPVVFREYPTHSGHLIAEAMLNDADALNALSLEMIDLLYAQLIAWAKNTQVVCVVLKGAGDKAFCAGGNIRKLYESILETKYTRNLYAERFFSREYQLDYLIHQYKKPVICLGKGFVMGGGIGLINGASHRIVCESSVLAMPEINIGLFPDVGSSWFLSRMPEGIGAFAGMTGVRMKAADALFVGLADHYLPFQQFNALEQQLTAILWKDSHAEGDADNHVLLTDALNQLAEPYICECPSSALKKYHQQIAAITANSAPDKILQKLLSSENPWLNKWAKPLKNGCPVTAWIVQEQIKRAATMSLAEIFKMEFDIAIQCTRYKDFCEGIRALLIDKDNQPQWEDKSLSDVSQEKIASFFISHWSDEEHPLKNLTEILSVINAKQSIIKDILQEKTAEQKS
ncbi:MAG: enoyl-CoA hydratase/isomerase family protein [Endozoicomonadaceae bacterium]|nr:enoyl-CoA hydratase/isomerase family protein [Endozoicomonadaceae bacterium]MCY4328679.1 enoyl-CoA hydratase/isomerase family protein [Endozoicomonadaceae bacterium]